jgi:glycosyltransferase involved in cell wall biosynthesis
MPTVLHLRTVTGRGGGPEKTLLASPRFIGGGYQLRLAYVRPVNDELYDMPARAAQAGATLIDIPERVGFDPRTWWRLVNEVRHSRPDILHAHDYKTNVLGVLLAKRFGLPVVTTLHGYGLGGGRLNWYYRIERWALRRMDRVIAVSEDIERYVLSIGIPRARCALVENAIDTDTYRRTMDTNAARVQAGLGNRNLVVGGVGRLCGEKGFDRLIRAVTNLSSDGIVVKLVLVGEGEERDRLEKLVRDLNCRHAVQLLGYRPDTVALYQALDVFVLSSVREASPNVVLEAMAMEVPVVATRIAGVPKLIEDGVNGLLVEPDDVEGLTRALETMLGDQALRARLARAGRQTIEERYTFAGRMKKIRAIYDDLLGLDPVQDGRQPADRSEVESRLACESMATT